MALPSIRIATTFFGHPVAGLVPATHAFLLIVRGVPKTWMTGPSPVKGRFWDPPTTVSHISAIRAWHVTLRRLLHQRQGVSVRVVEKRHPQIVIVHLGDQMRLTVEPDPPQA
jgi:hypothetical protein